MSLSRDLGHYYKLAKSDPNAVYLLSNSVFSFQHCLATVCFLGNCTESSRLANNKSGNLKPKTLCFGPILMQNCRQDHQQLLKFWLAAGFGTVFSVCHYLFDSRNCLLTSQGKGQYYKLNWPKRASAVYWLSWTLLYPCSMIDKKTKKGKNDKKIKRQKDKRTK